MSLKSSNIFGFLISAPIRIVLLLVVAKIEERFIEQNDFPSPLIDELIQIIFCSLSDDKYWILVLIVLKDSLIADFG